MKIRNYPITYTLQRLLLKPVSAGLYGFAGFFCIVLLSKYVSVMLGSSKSWHIDISDVTLSLLGFVFMFLINFLKHLQEFQSK